jgi:hypothetical protein
MAEHQEAGAQREMEGGRGCAKPGEGNGESGGREGTRRENKKHA